MLPIQNRMVATGSVAARVKRDFARMAEADQELPAVGDQRTFEQKAQDYQVTDKLGRRLHYKEASMEHGGESGNESKNAIRA